MTQSSRSRFSDFLSIALSSPIIKTALRITIALVLSIAWVGSIPVYGMPFAGCDVYGYATLELGCSTWPEFIRGVGFVLIWLVIAPPHTWSYFLVLLLLVMLSVYQEVRFNGLALLQSADGWYLVLAQGFPILLGGLVALTIYSGVRRVAQKSQQNNDSNDR